VPLTRLKLITTPEHDAQRLDEALSAWLTEALQRPVSKAKARRLIVAGAILVNGRRVRIAPQALVSGATIEAGIDIKKLFGDSTSRDKAFELSTDRILFEDDDLILVDKPPGLPAHPTADARRDNLFAAVRRFLAKRDGAAEPYVGIHQRLDRDTSGVVLFTKSKRANAATAEIFSNHQGIKIYQALTAAPQSSAGLMKPEWTIENYLGKIDSDSKRSKYGAVRSDGDFAATRFRVLAAHPRGLWVEAIPKTGRTYQIRVHLSEFGVPILGDDLYGFDGSRDAPRLMLHAVELVFSHPTTKREMSVKSPLPSDFQQCLDRIEKPYKLKR